MNIFLPPQETADGTTTYYLTDTQNPTGYAQPAEQKASATGSPSVTYFLGDRIFAQAEASGNVTYLLADGHGSTQQMSDPSGTVTAAFRYSAFGNAINFTPASAGTVFLFGGDAVYDPASGLYLHGNGVRPTNGFVFTQRDTYAGNRQDPLSLHKYLYANADPTNMSDPSAQDSEYTFTNGIAAHILFSAWVVTRGFTPHLRGPDATRRKKYYDLKPITHLGGSGAGFEVALAQTADAGQMSSYRGKWGTPGNSTDIVKGNIPIVIGHILGDDGTVFKVKLYTQQDPTTPSGLPGTGIVLYSLTPDEPPVGFPVPEVVPEPKLRPYRVQPQSHQFGPLAETYDYKTQVGLSALGILAAVGIVAIGQSGSADAGASLGGAGLTAVEGAV